MSGCILTVNGGSSSLKFAVFTLDEQPQRSYSGRIERVGQGNAILSTRAADGNSTSPCSVAADNLAAAANIMLDWLDERFGLAQLQTIGHRVVHGGAKYTASQAITPEMIDELRKLCPLDPAHLPGEIDIIESCGRRLPKVPQVACFDTAFHHDLPREAQLLPIPLRYEKQGVRRYGFHGLSYTYLLEELARVAGDATAKGRIILAHLGSGASMAAVRGGKCIDTTMAFTPTAGLVMGTRSGDLDPGVLVHLMRSEELGADQLDELVNRKSGLLGLSQTSADIRDLLAQRADPRAHDAVTVFCYAARKWIGALAAALGGVDVLVFAGGIGENSAEVRAEICESLAHLGICLDPQRNSASQAVISADGAPCAVWVIRTDEELMIAREVKRLFPAPSGEAHA